MSQVIDEKQLSRICPSVFAASGHQKMSARYAHIPTINVVRALDEAGFKLVSARQTNARSVEKIGHAKHMLRFRHEKAEAKSSVFPEIVLVNSHDGSSSYQLRAGIFRLVCKNGLIANDEFFCRRIKHTGHVVEQVVQAARDIIDVVPVSVKTIEEWSQIPLKKEHKEAFAESASLLKWDLDNTPISADRLLTPRRFEDHKNDLWTTFNVIQENMVRGGLRYRTENGQNMATRETNSVNENLRLNTALWTLTEKMASIMA